MKKYNFAIVGATGMVGRTFIKVLEERDLPINDIHFFSSARSAGSKLVFDGNEYIVKELTENSFDEGIDIALFSAGGGISLKFAPIAASKGVVVIDNSSAWRMNDEVPLVVPEVNPNDVFKHKGIIANPNCSTIQAVVPLRYIHDKYKIKRIVYSTYQAVSGSGVNGVEDLKRTNAGEEASFYPVQIASNALPHIDVFLDNGYTKEEMKMVKETQKIIGDDNIKVTVTCVRIPAENGHSVAINIETEKPFELSEVINDMKQLDGMKIYEGENYPTVLDANDNDLVHIGRIRRDFSVDNGLNMWVVADNIRKGAATNTVQIAEVLIGGQK